MKGLSNEALLAAVSLIVASLTVLLPLFWRFLQGRRLRQEQATHPPPKMMMRETTTTTATARTNLTSLPRRRLPSDARPPVQVPAAAAVPIPFWLKLTLSLFRSWLSNVRGWTKMVCCCVSSWHSPFLATRMSAFQWRMSITQVLRF